VENAIFVAVSITVAAIIGYITNYLAIKMLFLPRREWRVWGRRVPFTPGLIPKRKGEIAESLGRVVSDYLVTADGLKEVLRQPELRSQVERKLRELVESWAEREEMLEEVAARLLGPEQAARAKQSLEQLADRLIMDGVRSLWEDGTAKDAAWAAAPTAQASQGTVSGVVRDGSDESSASEAGVGGDSGLLAGGAGGAEVRSGGAEGPLLAEGDWQRSEGDAGSTHAGVGDGSGDAEGPLLAKGDRQRSEGDAGSTNAGVGDGSGDADGMVEDHGKPPYMRRPLDELLDQLHIPVDDLLAREAVPWIVQALRAELSSMNGLIIIHRIVTQMLGSLGGMMGMLAGMFVDEDKIARKVRDALLSYLASPAASDMLTGFLMKQKERLAERTPAELLGKLRLQLERGSQLPAGDGEGVSDHQSAETLSDAEWFARYVSGKVPWRLWIDRMWTMTPKQLLASRKEQLLGLTPLISDRLLDLVSDRIDQAVRTLNLSKLVQKQVEDFPMDQVEEVILSITGREFKAITWLGALLGGLIGIVQSLFYLWLGA
jgi:uncharacterized membrane protein YheB (UPF0754 family)